MRRTSTRVRGKRSLRRLRCTIAAAVALAAAVGGMAAAGPAGATESGTSSIASTPLPPALEAVRAAEATQLYGSPAERPLGDRKTGLISLGDSEISGEGVGTYDPGTNGPDNWCHRSPEAAVHRTGIAADVTYNVSCSGAYTGNIKIGGNKQYADELVQSDSLAIKARNTRIKMIVLVAGANDDLQFGPVMTDCVVRYISLQGPCEPKYAGGWQARVDALVPKVEQTVRDLRTVMTDAGYANNDYKLVLMGYPSPIGPDFHDNPDFPGKLICGGLGYDSDTVWGRNTAVPAFQVGMRKAAASTGATYLDNSRLFHGHEVCSESPWARGLYIDLSKPGLPDENSVRQSFHPNAAKPPGLRLLPDAAVRLRAARGELRRPGEHGDPGPDPGRLGRRVRPAEERGDRKLRGRARLGHPQRHGHRRLGLPRRPQPELVVRQRYADRPHRSQP